MSASVLEFAEAPPGSVEVHGWLHTPAEPSGEGLILTHGAGANCQAPLLVALANQFCEIGLTVLRADLPFRQARPTGPPLRGSAERDQAGLRAASEALRQRIPGRIFLGGHSYGGRQASMLAATDPAVSDGLLLLSYPLHPPKRRDALRTAHFPKLHTPALFVHGTRDGFGSVDEMRAALNLIPGRTELLEIAGAGHELISKKNRDELPQFVVDAFARFFAP